MDISFLPSRMFVYPAPRVSKQGRSNYMYVDDTGRTIPAGRTFARKAVKSYCVPLAPDGMKLNTGLNELIDNPFLNEEFALKNIRDQWLDRKDHLQSSEQITMQTYLEVMHNRPPGTYTDEKKAGLMDNETKENNFFERYSVSLSDGTNVFTSDTIEGQLGMIVMKACDSIAKSKAECNTAIHDFYIGAENEAIAELETKREKQGKAIAKLHNIFDNYPDFIAYQIAVVLDVVRGTVNALQVRNALSNFLWEQSKNMSTNIDRFNRITRDIESKEGMERLYIRYVFQQAINTRTIEPVNGRFIWHNKRNVKNLYDLGSKQEAIMNSFHAEMMVYHPETAAENFYGDLIQELRFKGVKLIEEEQPPKQEVPESFDMPEPKSVVKRGRPKKS